MFKLRRNKKDKKDSSKNKDHQQSPSIHSKESVDESDRHTTESSQSTNHESMSPDISLHSASEHPGNNSNQPMGQGQQQAPSQQNPFQMNATSSAQRQLPMLPTAGQSLSPIESAASNIQALMRGPMEINNTGGSFSRQPPQQQQAFNNNNQRPNSSFNNGRIPPNGFQQQQQQRQMANVSPQVVAQQQQQLITAIQNFTPWIRVKMLESPFPRYRHTASSIISEQGHIFAMGGLREGSVYGDLWAINSATMEARTIENFDGIPAPRVGHNSCLCGNAFIVFGGDTIQTNEKGELDNDLYLFNINSLKWTIPHPQGERPCGRYGHTVGVIAKTNVQSKLYLFGGQLDSQIFNDLWIFDLSSFRKPNSHWDKANLDADNAPALTNHTMVIHNYKLYIFGGASVNSLSNELFCFDPDNLRFTKFRCFGDIPPPMEEHSATTIKHLMFVYGGKNSKNEPIGDLYILNLNTLYWTRVESFALNPGARCGHSLTAITAKRSNSIESSSSSIHSNNNMQRRFTNVSISQHKLSENASSSTAILASSNNKLVIMGGDQLDYSSPVPGNFERINKDENAGVMIYVFDVDLYNEWSIKFKMYDLWDDKPPQISISKNMMPLSKFSTPNSSAMLAGSNNNSGVFAPEKHAIPSTVASNSSPLINNKEVSEPSRKSMDLLDTYVNSSADLLDSQSGGIPVKRIPPSSSTSPANISTESQNNIKDVNTESFTSPTTASLAGLVPISAISVGSPDTINNQHPTMDSMVNKAKSVHQGSPVPVQRENKTPIPVPDDDSNMQSASLSNAEKQRFAGIIESLESELSQLKLEMDNQAQAVSNKIHDLEVANSTLVEENNTLKESNNISSRELSDHITSLQNDHVAAKSRIMELENTLSNTSEKDELNKQIQHLQAQLHEKEVMAEQWKADMETLNQNSDYLENTLKEKDTIIQNLQNEVITTRNTHSKNLAISNEASVKELESLKQKLIERDAKIASLTSAAASTTNSREINGDSAIIDSDQSNLKRENIELQSELIKLQADNETLNQKFNEFEPLMNNSIGELANLNSVIQHQQEVIDELSIKSEKAEEYLDEIHNLQTENDILKKEISNLKKSRASQRSIANEQINSISTDVGKLVSLWKSKKEIGSELDKSLISNSSTALDDTEDFDDSNMEGVNRSVLSIGSTSSSNSRAFSKLQTQLNELIQLNKEYEIKNINLQSQLDNSNELAVNTDELNKLEENYKSAVNSVKKTGRALEMSQKELNKQKDINNELKIQLEELQLKSKNTSFDNEGQNDGDDEMNQYDFKIKDLEAELFIIKQERDELKDSVVSLRKKLINSGST